MIFFVFSLLFGAGGNFYLQGKVVHVADGDTVTILTGPAEIKKIRLYGIDCPETNQPFGDEAKRFMEKKVLWQEVDYSIQNTDRYGRSVAILTLADGENINEALVENGLAWVYPQYCAIPECSRWKRLENAAKMSRKGLWRARGAKAPWLWRAQKKR